MSDYKLTIGLEIHARMKTKTKLFCSCDNNTFNAKPNTHICPICTAQPWQLPKVNHEAIREAILLWHTFNSQIPNFSKFDRKSYFYPDSPSGYQITQFDKPVVIGGYVEVLVKWERKKFELNRMHIEGDAGKLSHVSAGSLVDLNRAGSPLVEIVTEPCFHSIEEVSCFLKELQKILRYTNVSDADMEKGMMRADVNISLNKEEDKELGIRCELKNMNSFSEISKAIVYEVSRQEKILNNGWRVDQETRGWDVDKGISVIQRSKEEAADYRYFPEPDLPPIIVQNEEIEEIKKLLVELPLNRYERFIKEYGLTEEDAYLLTETKDIANYFEAAVKQSKGEVKKVSNWILSELFGFLKEDQISIIETKVTPEHLAEIVCLIKDGIISGKIGKQIFPEVYKTGKNPTVIVEEQGLKQNSNLEELEEICMKSLDSNPKAIEMYKQGKTKILGSFVGFVMKETRGQANPSLVNEILVKLLKTK